MNLFKSLIFFSVSLSFVVLSVFISNFVTGTFNPKPTEIENIRKQITCALDSKEYENIRKITLIENQTSYGNKNGFVGDANIRLKRSGGKSKIVCGYLFYKVSNGVRPIDQKYMGLYMGSVDNNGGVQFGGHILPNDNNSIIKEVDSKTEVLMPLNTIFYDGTDRINIKQVDWISLLNVANNITFNIALNTTSEKGKIDLVQFGYKCINSESGEESHDCNLEIVNN